MNRLRATREIVITLSTTGRPLIVYQMPVNNSRAIAEYRLLVPRWCQA